MEKEFYAYLEKRFYEFKEHPELLEVGEKAILESAIEYMEKKTGLKEIKIVGEEESKSLRAKRAMPWKPANWKCAVTKAIIDLLPKLNIGDKLIIEDDSINWIVTIKWEWEGKVWNAKLREYEK